MKDYHNEFSFKDLNVWHKSIDYASKIIMLVDQINTQRKHYRLVENLEAAVCSVPSNIAEGKGRFSKKEYIHYLYVSRGSLYEVVSILAIFHRVKWIDQENLNELERDATEIAKMLNGLISSISK
jgi:four helix bundle protein